MQDTFLSALRAYQGFRGSSSLRTWLVQILKNKIIDHLRVSQRHDTVSNDSELADLVDANFLSSGIWNRILPDWARDPGQLCADKQFLLALQRCIGKLPSRFQQAFILRVIDNIDAEQVCKDLAITPSNLWVVLHRARLGLRDCLEKSWYSA